MSKEKRSIMHTRIKMSPTMTHRITQIIKHLMSIVADSKISVRSLEAVAETDLSAVFLVSKRLTPVSIALICIQITNLF